MGSLTPSRPFKIAILINTDEPPYIPLFTSAYTSIFNTLSPTSKLTFYSPPLLSLPSPTELSNHDLLIIGGGTYVVDESAPWVVKELEFLKSTVRDFPRLKIVAICFGHQKCCQAFGGELGWNKAGKTEVHSPLPSSLSLLFLPFHFQISVDRTNAPQSLASPPSLSHPSVTSSSPPPPLSPPLLLSSFTNSTEKRSPPQHLVLSSWRRTIRFV
jgi:hypothetical protein